MASVQSPIIAAGVLATKHQQHFLQWLHYIAPALVLLYYLIATTISVCTLQNLKPGTTSPRRVLLSLVSLVVISYLVESCMLLTDTTINGARQSSTDSNVSTSPNVYEPERQGLTSCLLTANWSGVCTILTACLDNPYDWPCQCQKSRCVVSVLRLVVHGTSR